MNDVYIQIVYDRWSKEQSNELIENFNRIIEGIKTNDKRIKELEKMLEEKNEEGNTRR